MRHFAALILLTAPLAHSAGLADAARGAKILTERQCLGCHDFFKAAGRSTSGPLARFRKTHLKPAQLVGAMWSHLPTMWAARAGNGAALQPWTEQDARDLMAWFAAAGFFEPAGDIRRGTVLFENQGCIACHPIASDAGAAKAGNGDSLPVDQWTSLRNPIALLHAVWRHAPSMKAALERKTMNWPSLTVPEFADLLSFLYTRTPPNGSISLTLGDPQKGKAILTMKGCVSCHSRLEPSREAGLLHSFTELSVVFWNHAPMMTSLPASLSREEIADVVAYLWALRYFEDHGNVVRGRSVFERKRCAACHPEARPVARNSAAAMFVAAWKHFPAALQQAGERSIPWARFEDGEMADLLAYLSSLHR